MIYFFIVLLMVLLSVSFWINVVLAKKNLMLEDQREALVDEIEESLDDLEVIYDNIAHAAEIPVLSDEPVIRELLADIKRAKNAVLAIASRVVIYGSDMNEKDED